MKRIPVPLLVFLLLLGSTVFFIERWQTMPTTAAQVSETPLLVVDEGKLWAPLHAAMKAFDVKLEERQGQRVLCREERCALLSPQVLRMRDGVEMVDLFWLAEAFGLAQTPARSALPALDDAPESGGLAPDFTLPDLEGRPRSLSEFRGKKTVVFIWGSW